MGYGAWYGNTPGPFPGDIMEIVWFRSALSSTERDKLNSYLAIKYGTTMPIAYLNSSGSTVYAASTGYNNNIAGIGLDQASGLHQKQSNSVNDGNHVILSLGSSVGSTNATNGGAFSVDQSFLIWGDNGGSESYGTSVTASGTSYLRMGRVWRTQQSGTVPASTVAFPYSGSSPLTLIVGDAADFSGTNIAVSLSETQVIEGVSYQRTASPTSFDANSYFTFATPSPLTVTSTADTDTLGTLRYAINHANANTSDDAITFDIDGAGPHTITLTSDLPHISDAGISIDGTTQSGASCGQLSTGSPHTLKIFISGGDTVGNAFRASADDITLKGLAIGGFQEKGIYQRGAYSNLRIECNYLGVDPDGVTSRPLVQGGLSGANQIESSLNASIVNNLFSGNNDDANDTSFIVSHNASGVTITGNVFGLNAAGTAALSNGVGVMLIDSSNITFGGNTSELRNIVSGNGDNGVQISNVSDLDILGNYIGLNTAGTSAIANVGDGIEVSGSGTEAAIYGNSIYGNGGLGIDLSGGTEDASGVTANDSGDSDSGANQLLNYPVINAFTAGGSQSVEYDFDLDVPNNSNGYRIEFFKNSAADSSGYGEGDVFLGGVDIAHSGGDLNFTGSFTASVTVSAGEVISATTTRKTGASSYDVTSEFGLSVSAVAAPSPLVVTSTADTSTLGTLRYAITHANANAGDDAITFNIAGAGPHTITLASALPSITDAGVSIDGTTQSGASCGDLWGGTPHTLKIEIDGTNAFSALEISADSVDIRGVSVFDAKRNVNFNNASSNSSVTCSYFGLEVDGIGGGGFQGVVIGGSNNIVGGGSAGDGNVLSGNDFNGVVLLNGGSNVTLQGNFIGTSPAGTASAANGWAGIGTFTYSSAATVGEIRDNLISGNAESGIHINSFNAISGVSGDVIIAGNYIGVSRTGNAALLNGSHGINFENTSISGIMIGGAANSDRNIISGNGGNGINVSGGTGISISGNYIGLGADGDTSLGNSGHGVEIGSTAEAAIYGNSIYGNGGLSIDLSGGTEDANGVTANDSGDSDSGANSLLNYPVINTFAADGSTSVGYDFDLDVASNANGYRVEFFKNSAADASGYGEGEVFLGSVDVAHVGGDLNFTGSFTANATVDISDTISATATRKTGASSFDVTSEFAASVSAFTANPAELDVTQAVQVIEDGLVGGDDTVAIPGATLRYTFAVQNNGAGAADAGTTVIINEIPISGALVVADFGGVPGGGPLSVTDGSPSSGLSYSYVSLASGSDDLDFSDDDGATWSYTPTDGGDGTDPAITHIRVTPSGTFNGNAGTPPNISLSFDIVLF